MSFNNSPYWYWPADRLKLAVTAGLVVLLVISAIALPRGADGVQDAPEVAAAAATASAEAAVPAEGEDLPEDEGLPEGEAAEGTPEETPEGIEAGEEVAEGEATPETETTPAEGESLPEGEAADETPEGVEAGEEVAEGEATPEAETTPAEGESLPEGEAADETPEGTPEEAPEGAEAGEEVAEGEATPEAETTPAEGEAPAEGEGVAEGEGLPEDEGLPEGEAAEATPEEVEAGEEVAEGEATPEAEATPAEGEAPAEGEGVAEGEGLPEEVAVQETPEGAEAGEEVAEGEATPEAEVTPAEGEAAAESETIPAEEEEAPSEAPVDVPFAVSSTDSTVSVAGKEYPALEGTAQPGSTVRISLDGVVIGETTADEQGNWTFVLPALAAGTHQLLIETEGDGEVGAAARQEPIEITVPEGAVEPPETNLVTGDAQPTISGTAQPNSTVQLVEGDSVLAESKVDESGTWTLQPEEALGEGEHEVAVVIVDPHGVELSRSEPLSIEVPGDADAIAALRPLVTNTRPLSPYNTQPMLRGVTAPGALVRVLEGDQVLGRMKAGQRGNWFIALREPLAPGKHQLMVVANTPDGVQRALVSVEIDENGQPVKPPTVKKTRRGRIRAGSLLQGKAPPGSTVQLYAGEQLIGETTANDKGVWKIRIPADLPAGKTDFRVTVLDEDGNVLAESRLAVRRVLATRPPTKLPTTGADLISNK